MAGENGGTSAPIHGLGYLFSALRREGLIADELLLQLATFLGSLDLFLELTVPRTLTTYQVLCGGKQGTDGPELSRMHSSTRHPRDKRREASAHGAIGSRVTMSAGNGSVCHFRVWRPPTYLLSVTLCSKRSRVSSRNGFASIGRSR